MKINKRTKTKKIRKLMLKYISILDIRVIEFNQAIDIISKDWKELDTRITKLEIEFNKGERK